MCKMAATENYRVFHKIIFRGCPIIYSFSNSVVGETVNYVLFCLRVDQFG